MRKRIALVLLAICGSYELLALSRCETLLEPYKKFIEDGTYQGAELDYSRRIPQSRYETFLTAFKLFEEANGSMIVELGTTRSFVHGGLPGCNEDDTKWWTPEEPANWDWGAGCFTLMAATSLGSGANPCEIHTVDVSPAHIKRCKTITEKYKSLLHYHVSTSEDFLKRFPVHKKIDLLYLDTGDMTPIEPTALLQLREAKIIVERDLISPNGLILIDDVRNGTPRKFGEVSEYGKAKYSLAYLLENGFEMLMDEYQVLLRKKN